MTTTSQSWLYLDGNKWLWHAFTAFIDCILSHQMILRTVRPWKFTPRANNLQKKPSDADFRENTLLCRENYKNISFLFYSWYIGLFTMKKGTEWLVPYYTRGSIQDTFIFEMHYIWFPLRSRFYLNRFVPFFYRLDLQRMVSGPYTSEIGGVMEQIHVWR